MNGPATLFTSACDSPATAPLLSPSRPSWDGGVRWSAFGIPGILLFLSASPLSCTYTRRVALPTYQTISHRDMYRLAKLFSNGRLFGILRPYQKLSRRRGTRGRVLFFFLPLPIADISSCKQMWKRGRRKCLRTPAYPRRSKLLGGQIDDVSS